MVSASESDIVTPWAQGFSTTNYFSPLHIFLAILLLLSLIVTGIIFVLHVKSENWYDFGLFIVYVIGASLIIYSSYWSKQEKDYYFMIPGVLGILFMTATTFAVAAIEAASVPQPLNIYSFLQKSEHYWYHILLVGTIAIGIVYFAYVCAAHGSWSVERWQQKFRDVLPNVLRAPGFVHVDESQTPTIGKTTMTADGFYGSKKPVTTGTTLFLTKKKNNKEEYLKVQGAIVKAGDNQPSLVVFPIAPYVPPIGNKK